MKHSDFTFKTDKPTGKYKSFFDSQYLIKYKKVEVGYFSKKYREGKDVFRVNFKVWKNENDLEKEPNCKWKWVTFKKEFFSLEEAKMWINEIKETIWEKYDIALEE
jgi:hypothetical protein